MAEQLILMNGLCLRGLPAWIALATSSLPVPVSPVMRIVVVVGATFLITSKIFAMCGLAPTISLRSISAGGS